MNTADTIRSAVAEVRRLREQSLLHPEAAGATACLKRFQARRFAGMYADLLASPVYGRAARFFLEELYGDRDFAQRDAQFARIAGAVDKLLPRDAGATAAALAQLHALTESLDHAMARAHPLLSADDAAGYVQAWKATGRRVDRERQLEAVVAIGEEMARLTRMPGLRMVLKMMRGPASASGLDQLQSFLESGFDTFAAVARLPGGVPLFLHTVRERESDLMVTLFDVDPVACETRLRAILGQAP